MKLTDEQAKAIIKICSCSEINEDSKIRLIKLMTNNDIEMLLAKIKWINEED